MDYRPEIKASINIILISKYYNLRHSFQNSC